jgi:hypothetical protein
MIVNGRSRAQRMSAITLTGQSIFSKADVAHARPRRPVALRDALVSVRDLLVVRLDFTDDIDIRTVGLDHEKFAHNCWLKNNVGNVEIVGNYHQI